MERIGYVRVSTSGQNTVRQEVMMEQLGVNRVYIEYASGKNCERPKLQEMLNYVREGDTIIVESFSRLARNTKDLLEIVEELKDKRVSFISKKENVDTDTPQGRLTLTLFGAISEFERDCILERQREGIAIAKKQGRLTGRRLIEIGDIETIYTDWKKGTLNLTGKAKELGVSRSTLFNRLKSYDKRSNAIFVDDSNIGDDMDEDIDF